MAQATWITNERLKKSGCIKRAILAEAVGTKERVQRRWGTGETSESVIPFDKYAKLFQEDVAVLKEDYRRVRKENGYELDDASQARLKVAIKECHAQQLLLNTKNHQGISTDELNTIIVDALNSYDMTVIETECNQTLITDIEAADLKKLDALRKFISEIAKASIKIDRKLLDGGKHKPKGRANVWLIELLIDAGENLDFHKRITVTNGSLDNEALPHFCLSDKAVEEGTRDITYTLIHALNKEFRPMHSEPPCPNDDPIAYENYCGELNVFFRGRNSTEQHMFCTANKNNKMYDFLLEKCRDLRVYAIGNTTEKSAHSRFNDQDLGGWLAQHLGAISDRSKQILKSSQNFKLDNNSPNKKEGDMTTINVHVNQNQTNTQTNAQDNHSYNSAQWQQFQQTIDALEREIQTKNIVANPEYRELKNAVRDIKEHLETSPTLPEGSQSWLEKSLQAISKADAVWGLTEKTIKAIAVLTSIGVA